MKLTEPNGSCFAKVASDTLDEMLRALPPLAKLPDDFVELLALHCDETAGRDVQKRCLYYGILGVAMKRLLQAKQNN